MMYKTIIDQIAKQLQEEIISNYNTIVKILSAHVYIDEEDREFIMKVIEADKNNE